MSERRFTRLKASLSKETAAKTRETVSRELRQSLTNSTCTDTALLYGLDGDYERSLRQWNEELRARYSFGTCPRTGESPNLEQIEEEEPTTPTNNKENTFREEEVGEEEPTELDLLNAFTVPEDDIQVVNESKSNTFDYARYYPTPDRTKPSSPFAHECILHYTEPRHLIKWKSLDRSFGTVFDTSLRPSESSHAPTSSSSTSNHELQNGTSNQSRPGHFTSNLESNHCTAERPVFECDLENQIGSLSRPGGSFVLGSASAASTGPSFLLSTQNRLIRDGSASVISLEPESLSLMENGSSSRALKRSGNNTNGWLNLTRDDTHCFLTFYTGRSREKILWHIEVNRKVTKLAEPPSWSDQDPESDTQADLTRSCFRVSNKYLIFTDQRYTDDWIKDINSNIGTELNPGAELARILGGDGPAISRRLKSSALISQINLMAAYSADLSKRVGSYPAMKNSVARIGYRSGGMMAGNCFRFYLAIRGFEIASNDRNKSTIVTTSELRGGGVGGPGTVSNSSTSGDSFFLRLSLFDARLGKISEEFRFTVSADIKGLRPSAAAESNRGYDQRLLCSASRALFTVDLSSSSPGDVYLVLRVERTTHRLMHFNCSPNGPSGERSGSNSSSNSSSSSLNSNLNNNKANQQGIIASHVEPYAWSARPLFQECCSSGLGPSSAGTVPPPLETSPNFGIFFKLDASRLSDEFILNSLRNQQSASGGGHSSGHSSSRSQTALNGRLEIELQPAPGPGISGPGTSTTQQSTFHSKHTGGDVPGTSQGNAPESLTLNPSLFVTSGEPPMPGQTRIYSPILEIQSLRLLHLPFTEYFNLLYIYPLSLKFDSQRVFSKARNLAVTVEIRDSDEPDPGSGCSPRSLPIIFGRPHDGSLFVRTATTAVARHHVTPEFFEEIKVALPLTFSEKLHVLFTFTHLSCKKDLCTYNTVGYAWLPISPDAALKKQTGGPSAIHAAGLSLSVFASLPHSYLSCQALGLGKGLSMPDVKFVGKDLFRLSTVLISSVASRDGDLQGTLSAVIKITRSARDDSKEISQMLSLERSLPKMLRDLPDCDQTELIHYSHLILQQLLKLLVFAANQDLITESFHTILALVEKFRKECPQGVQLLSGFIEDTFKTAEFCGVYVHDQLIVLLNQVVADFGGGLTSGRSGSSSSSPDDLKLLLNNLWFILRIMTKSMLQYLVETGRATLEREDRFEPEFTASLKRFLESTSAIIATFSRAEEAPSANQALAHFMTRLCSFYDRSVVFNAFYHHVSVLSSRDVVVQELKLHSIAILLSHEHYVAYCNPLIGPDIDSLDTGDRVFNLTAETARKHFPVFLALGEFRAAYASRPPSQGTRPISLYILRNQLAKHLLLGAGNSSRTRLEQRKRERILALYLPVLSVVLENTNRLVDSTIACKDGAATFGGTVTTIPGSTGSGGRPGTAGSGGDRKSTSPYSTINEMPALFPGGHLDLHQGSSGLHLTRSTSEISNQSTLTSVASFGSLTSSSTASTLTNASSSTLTSHHRTNSMVSTATLATVASAAASGSGRDRFTSDEVRDLFICLLSVVQVLDLTHLNQLPSRALKDLFLCLECSLNAFEYKPALPRIQESTSRSKTLPSYLTGISSGTLDLTGSGSATSGTSSSAGEIYTNYLLNQHLSMQTSLITLRSIHLYLDNDQRPIDTAIIAQILSIYLTLMSLPQSQSVAIQVFDSIRYFVAKFALLLFSSDAFLSPIIGKVIKYCNSSLTPIRQGATDLLYCLLSTNLKRTRFETIVCVSRLASSDSHGLLYLQSSLNRIELLASADSGTSGTQLADSGPASSASCPGEASSYGIVDGGPCEDEGEVSILHIVGRIREILKATKQIREEASDPYLASELRLQLAHSYARTSRSLLRTWLENLAEVHERNGDWAEAALCLCQVIAILLEQLGSKDIEIPDGMAHIRKVSENIYAKESIKQESDWLELEESHVGVEVLEKMVKEAVGLLEKAELWELAPHVLKVMISCYEREYEHTKLSIQYKRMADCHSTVQRVNDSGKRLFDTFFRIAFYYPSTYGASKVEYIYKRSKVVSLAEMTGTMQALYPGATFLSADPVSLATFNAAALAEASQADSNNNNSSSSSGPNARSQPVSIVITHVTPYVDRARNAFERHIGVSQFVYEARIGGRPAQSVAQQYKKRVILTVGPSFPYFLKRVPVADRREVILSPIEVAIDEMQERVHQLEHVIGGRDAKHLQLILQGSVNATVNAGPIAYANAFLRKPEDLTDNASIGDLEELTSTPDTLDGTSPGPSSLFSESQKHLKFLFEQFLDLCESALKLNEKLIKPNQVEYHQNLKANFEKLKDELDFFYERPTSIQIFDVISGSTFA